MKITFVSDCIFPYHKGGKETRLYEVSKRLARKGHEVHIYTLKWWEGSKIKKENGVTLHGICRRVQIYAKNGIRSIGSALFFSLHTIIPLLEDKSDIVDIDHMPILQLYPARIVLWLKRKKMFATWHEVWGKNYWKSYLGKTKGHLAYILERLSVKLPDKIITVSDFTKSRLIIDLKAPPQKIYFITNGVDLEKIEHIPAIKEKSDLVYIGRLLAHKKLDVLIKVVAKVKETFPQIKCNIIGQGPEKKKLIDLINELGVVKNVFLLGSLEEKEAIAYLKSSKIFVLPSEREGFGISVLEANAAGLPVIVVVYPHNAAQHLIKKGINGFVCKPNIESITNQVLELINNVQLREQVMFNAKEFVKQFDWDRSVDKLLSIYKQNQKL